MKEELLQFIWRYQYFNPHELLSESGEPVQVVYPGELNTHQGPDFLYAQIRIGGTLLAGSVELHRITSDWRRHAHDGDIHYRNVILHVVWENDGPVRGGDSEGQKQAYAGSADDIPILVLQQRVPKLLLLQYEKWMKSPDFVPCHRQLTEVDTGEWGKWKEQLLWQRLRKRTLQIEASLEANRYHWEQTTWWLLARNFGLPVNTTAFDSLGKSLPVRLLARYKGDLFRMEALLLGQAGLLETDPRMAPDRDYPALLQKEWRHLRVLHHLTPIPVPLRFFRMRPAQFPTIRLAQLAALASNHPAWFGAIRDAGSPLDLEPWLAADTSKYWQTHYRLSEHSSGIQPPPGTALEKEIAPRPEKRRQGCLGRQMKNSLLINTFVPLLFAYGRLRSQPAFCEKAIRWLREARPEKNAILQDWEKLGVDNNNAADSQALLELKNTYCQARNCLYCAIGRKLLGKPDARP